MELKIFIVGEPVNLWRLLPVTPAHQPNIESIQTQNLLEKASVAEWPNEVALGSYARNESILQGGNTGCGINKGMGLARGQEQKCSSYQSL